MSTRNNAATLLVRELLTKLEEGSADVLELAAGEGVLSLKYEDLVLENSIPPARAAPPVTVSLRAGDAHTCGRVIVDASGTLFCPGCGAL